MEVAKMIKVYGRVQGVFFRDSAKRVADEHGVFGWVKNMTDGTVEILVQGEEEKVKKFIKWCQKGTEHSLVEKVVINDYLLEKKYSEFNIFY